MENIKEKLKSLARAGVLAAGIAGGWEIGVQTSEHDEQADMPREAITQLVRDVRGQIDSNMPLEDRARLEQLLEIMAQTGEGCQLLRTLENAGTLINIVDSFDNESTLGRTTGTEKIEIKKSSLHEVQGLWVLAHEAGHVRNHVNFRAVPRTLDDAYTLNTIDEALAERGAFIVVKQAQQSAPEFMTEEGYCTTLKIHGYDFLQDQADAIQSTESRAVFDKRMQNNRESTACLYENQAKDFYYGSKLRWDWPRLEKNPNWNKVVKKMSGGTVHSISHLPIPSWHLIRDMIIEDNRSSVDRADLSCAKQYKNELLQGNGFKLEIFDVIANLLMRLHADSRPEILEVFKEMMPESYMQAFQTGGWMPTLAYVEEGEAFMREQTNQGYLNKAIKAMQNPRLMEVGQEDEFFKKGIEETAAIFKTYQHVFLGGENQQQLHRRALQNIHL